MRPSSSISAAMALSSWMNSHLQEWSISAVLRSMLSSQQLSTAIQNVTVLTRAFDVHGQRELFDRFWSWCLFFFFWKTMNIRMRLFWMTPSRPKRTQKAQLLPFEVFLCLNLMLHTVSMENFEYLSMVGSLSLNAGNYFRSNIDFVVA